MSITTSKPDTEVSTARRRLYICCHEITTAPITAGFSYACLAEVLREYRDQRPVYVAAMRNGPRFARAWVSDPVADWIVFRQAAPREQRIAFTVHQAAHMLLGHRGTAVCGVMFGDLLFPNVSQALGTAGPRSIPQCGIATREEEAEAVKAAGDLIKTVAGQGRRCSARKSTIIW